MIFDIAMPLTLFLITLASMLLNQKVEGKLKTTFEEKEFSIRDVVLLVGMMVVTISLIALLRTMVAPLTILFMFSYSTLLFIFTYLFSNKRWYLGILTPAVFVLSYVLLRNTTLWSEYLLSIYGAIFAILITLYIGSLFTWKSTLVFTALLTIADIVLVLVTKTMIEAFTAGLSLNLPVMVSVPAIPPVMTKDGLAPVRLGLGDFFFAGLFAIQTFKRYGKKLATYSIIGMSISFFLFEMVLSNYDIQYFPGTLMIICGWILLVFGKMLRDRDKAGMKPLKDGKTKTY